MGLISLNNRVINIGSSSINLTAVDPDITVSPTLITGVTNTGTTCTVKVCGAVSSNVTTVTDACTWIVTTSPVYPSASPGTSSNIIICCNGIGSAARSATVCYTPIEGTTKCVCICQNAGLTAKCVDFTCISCLGNDTVFARALSSIDISPAMSVGEYYCLCFGVNLVQPISLYGCCSDWCLFRNGTCICGGTISAGISYCDIYNTYSVCIPYGDNMCICTRTCVKTGNLCEYGSSYVPIVSVTGCPNYCIGTTRTSQSSFTCGMIV